MSLFLCWVVFPVLLALVAVGCGLLVETVAGFRLPGPLVPAVGVAAIIVAGNFTTMLGATAQLTVPLVVGMAVAGYGLSYPWRGRRLDAWAVAAAASVFAVYAAPIVLTGTATFAGFLTLDDTATWLAMTDRIIDHGRTFSDLAPSTYQQVLDDYLGGGTPVGGLIVLGLAGKLVGQDIAWLFQPTMAVYAAGLALVIYVAAERLVSSRGLRALVAFLGAQASLLFAYAFWSGIKELATALLIALVAALVAVSLPRWESTRAILPAAVAAAALLAVLSAAGGVWLIAPTILVAAVLVRRGPAVFARVAAALVVLVAVLSIPELALARKFLSGAAGGELTAADEVANLGHPLSKLQLFGIWPATDFRTSPHDATVTHVLIGVVVAAVAVGVVLSWRRRAWGLPAYLVVAVAGALLAIVLRHVGLSSPWLIAKAMAEASPALVAVGAAGAAAVFETGRRVEGGIALTAIAAGVLWSNALVYSNVWLAPRSQLAELETIGQRFAGDGPTLMTEHLPFGARHFLRRMDPEGASERRRRLVTLRGGGVLDPGTSADLDAFELDSVLVYRTLVLRRSPVESRPPSVYDLTWKGHWYEVWQRPKEARPTLEHLSLGNPLEPAATPGCDDVLRLGEEARAAGGSVASVRRPDAPVVMDLAHASFPAAWNGDESRLGVLPHGGGEVSVTVDVPGSGKYGLWLGGLFRRTLTTVVDGREVGSVRHILNNEGQWTPLGDVDLERGSHTIVLRYGGSRLAPGAGGLPFTMGPLALSTSTADLPVSITDPGRARSLCGARLDWIEALG